MRRASALVASLSVAVALVVAGSVPAAAAPAPARGFADVASPVGTYTFTGHGWGHGRGMGQYGALGYALNYHWTYDQILRQYYGGTTMASNAGNPIIDVELTSRTGKDTVATGTGLTLNGQPVPVPGTRAVRLRPNGDGSFTAQTAATECGSGNDWVVLGTYPAGTVLGDASGFTTQCGDGGLATYHGALVAIWKGTTSYTFNRVAVEDYLKGVVPRESPASWGSLGGLQANGQAWGLEALKAQAVAARSYALASSRPSGATTCDTTACQVYYGYWSAASGALEEALSNQAVDATAGRVMRTPAGAIARTEFSSSTGGWTAGGAFTAVEDLGDAVAQNPNHTWTVTLTAAQIADRLGLPGVSGITVTQRNGLGDLGGRVTALTVIDSAARAHTYTGGDTIRSAMGLKSDWFTVSGVTPGQAQAMVKSLYRDVLGRDPEPGGLASWSAAIQSTGSGRVVANGIVYSREHLVTVVAKQYRAALRREPEPEGLAAWVGYLQNGAGLPSLQSGIYSSPESLQVLGGGDTRAWVAAVYSLLLGRQAVPWEIDYWTQVGLQSRLAVVSGIIASSEAGLHRLEGYYQQYLGRSLDSAGAVAWLPYMNNAGDFQVPVFIGGSSEYWSRAQLRYPS